MNFLGHYAFTRLLEEELTLGAPSRVCLPELLALDFVGFITNIPSFLLWCIKRSRTMKFLLTKGCSQHPYQPDTMIVAQVVNVSSIVHRQASIPDAVSNPERGLD